MAKNPNYTPNYTPNQPRTSYAKVTLKQFINKVYELIELTGQLYDYTVQQDNINGKAFNRLYNKLLKTNPNLYFLYEIVLQFLSY